MAVTGDDEMIVDDDAERLGDVGDRLGHLDIGARRAGIAGGVVLRR